MLNTAITLKIYSDCLNKLGRNSPEFETFININTITSIDVIRIRRQEVIF